MQTQTRQVIRRGARRHGEANGVWCWACAPAEAMTRLAVEQTAVAQFLAKESAPPPRLMNGRTWRGPRNSLAGAGDAGVPLRAGTAITLG